MQITEIVMISLYVLIGVLALIGLIKGLTRGICRQTVRSMTVICAAILAFIIARSLIPAIRNYVDGKTVGETVGAVGLSGVYESALPEEMRNIVGCFDSEFLGTVVSLPIMTVVVPVLFVLLFVVLSAVLLLVHVILCGVLGFAKRKNNIATRLLGGVLGLVQGVAIAAILIFPAAGLLTVSAEAAEQIRAESTVGAGESTTAAVPLEGEVTDGGTGDGETQRTFLEIYDEILKPIYDSPVITLVNKCGGDAMMSAFCTDGEGEEKTDMREDIVAIIGVVNDASKMNGMDMQKLTEDDKAKIDALIARIERSDYLSSVVAGFIRGIAVAVDSGYLEVQGEEPYKGIMESGIAVFRDTNGSTLHADLKTIRDVYFLMSDEDVILAFAGAEGAMSMEDALAQTDENGDTVIRRVSAMLNENEHTRSLTGVLTKVSVSVMAKAYGDGLGIDTEQTYENVKSGLSKISGIDKGLTDEEYTAEVASTINTTLKDSEIDLEPGVVDEMAKYVTENYKEKLDGELTDEELDDIIISYYDAYLKTKNNA